MYGIDKKVQFNHMVNTASFSSDRKQWTLDVTANENERKVVRSNFVLMCTGMEYPYESQ